MSRMQLKLLLLLCKVQSSPHCKIKEVKNNFRIHDQKTLKRQDVNMMIKTETTIYTCMLLAKTENGQYLSKLRSEHINLMCTSKRK
jgi:hypothetical protein